MSYQLIVVAKAPVAGRVKTRLCPPCTPDQAARLARAALLDTLDAAQAASAQRLVLLLDGVFVPPRAGGWHVVVQRGTGLAQRLANGFTDTAAQGLPSLLIGMDTPQVTGRQLDRLAHALSTSDSVLAPAVDGGWWALGLREPRHGRVLHEVPMSRPDTCQHTRDALAEQGLSIASGPVLRDVDTADDAMAVAAQCPQTRFAREVGAQIGAAR